MKPISRLTVIGLGLIGGSFALALKKAHPSLKVCAVDLNSKALAWAQSSGLADRVSTDIEQGVRDAELIVVAAPVMAMPAIFKALARYAPKSAAITDVGSTRQVVEVAAQTCLQEAFTRYVPVHPIAGAATSGVLAARADLFVGAKAVLTPHEHMDERFKALVASAWRDVGVNLCEMSAFEHDEVFASVSHLPHLAAFALVKSVVQSPEGEKKLEHAGTGFRDTTRVAGSNARMWRDICESNKAAISKAVATYREELAYMQACLDAEKWDELEALFERASSVRRAMNNS